MPLRPALLACLLLAAFPVIATEPVRAVERTDIDRYAGQWHEIAHLPVSFQKQCVGDITANYGLRRDGRISVTNACRNGDGERVVAEGVARPVAGHPGQLQVRFVPDWLSWVPLVWADYWVPHWTRTISGRWSVNRTESTCGSSRACRKWIAPSSNS